ncbi:MAG: hypothetical protein IJS01_00855 [Lentisphaeria bacterium]|nr:hypothetical protein [Lentisphaeria bacterium]
MMRCLLVLLLTTAALTAAQPPSVKDFGAKGDGKTDDTEALQRAADAVTAKLSTYASETLYFPRGRYKISRRITLKKIHLRGDSAVIVQTDPAADIFYYDFAWNTRVTGIEFQGGRDQLSFWNANTEKGQLTVRDCRFFNARGVAVTSRLGTNSTIFSISNCVFYKCGQAVVSNCDWTSIRDIWLTSSSQMRKKAVIVNGHGVMNIDSMLGVPLCNGDEQRWVDNYGSLFVTGTRFGGEGGGFTPVYNFAKYRAFNIPVEISIQRCWISSGSSPNANCAVYCIEVPNLINIGDCTGGPAAIAVAPGIDLANYFYTRPDTLLFRAANVGNGANVIPEGLLHPVTHPPRPDNQLTREQTLAAAEKAQLPSDPVIPAEIDLQREGAPEWNIDEFMDGGVLKNSEFLHLIRKNGRMGLMRRVPGSKVGDWPHVTIKNIKLDIGKYPILVVDPVSASPAEFAVKIVVPEKKKLFAVMRRQMPLYRLKMNLAERFPELAEHPVFSMKVYYVPKKYVPPRPNGAPVDRWAKAGSTMWFRTIGFFGKKPENTGKTAGKE